MRTIPKITYQTPDLFRIQLPKFSRIRTSIDLTLIIAFFCKLLFAEKPPQKNVCCSQHCTSSLISGLCVEAQGKSQLHRHGELIFYDSLILFKTEITSKFDEVCLQENRCNPVLNHALCVLHLVAKNVYQQKPQAF